MAYNVAGHDYYEGTTTSAGGDTTSVIDTSLRGPSGASSVVGRWVVATSGTNDDEIVRSTNFDGTSDMTVTAFGATVPNAMTYQLWPDYLDPRMIRSFISDAILAVTSRAFDPEEDISLHGDGRQARFDIPSQLAMISEVQFRTTVESIQLHAMERVFDESTDSDITQAVDQEDYKHGGSSLKLTIAAGAAAGDFISDSIDSLDLSRYTHIEGWMKSTVAPGTADFVIRLDSGTVQGDGTDLEIISIPNLSGISADTWTFFRQALATPELDTDIVSVGIEYNVDIGAVTVWVDDLRATRTAAQRDSALWTSLPPRLWDIDRQARDLILTGSGVGAVGYALIKLIGGDKLAIPSAATSVMEVDDFYIVATATERALMATSGGPNTDPQRRREQVAYWRDVALRAKRALPPLTDVRRVD